MLKVNSEKILSDYKALTVKRNDNRAQIEMSARTYAVNRGYDEAQTIDFINYVQDLENDGLTDEELERLEFLEQYVHEVSDDDYAAAEAVTNEVVY